MNFKIDFIYKVIHEKPISVPIHTHGCYELVYYATGKGTVKYKEELLNYSAGDIIIVDPLTLHDEINFLNSVNTVIGFYVDKNKTNVPTGKFSADNTIKNLIENMLTEMVEQKSGFEDIIDKQFELLFLYLNRPLKEVTNKSFDKIFSNLDNYIEENLSSPITLESLAKTYNYSASHFRHIFTKHLKLSPKQFIIQKRMNKAQTLLEKTQKSITEIALECGFYDTAQFSKLFKKRFNVSPSEYKKTYKA
ncbi:MAG: AraC family transcriptional regulator [Clostridiales bacterium]|nr:AraC family transcriptional regulator [Clostridiales bacterium]